MTNSTAWFITSFLMMFMYYNGFDALPGTGMTIIAGIYGVCNWFGEKKATT